MQIVKSVLDNSDMSNMWHTQTFPNVNWLKLACKQKLSDQYMYRNENNQLKTPAKVVGTNYSNPVLP